MATRTAPTVAAASPSEVITTLHLIDASGDQFTDALKTTSQPALDTLVEAWAASYQVASQSSLWKVTQKLSWVGDRDPDNADAGYRGSVKAGVNLLYKDLSTLMTQTPRLVAPVAATMQGNQDIPLLSADPQFTNLLAALAAILSTYNLETAQYTDRRERSNNPVIKA